MSTLTDSARSALSQEATTLGNREILKHFFISIGLLLVPAGVLAVLFSFEARPPWVMQAYWVLHGCWFAASAIGLFCGVRAVALSNRKTDGFGILAVFLHIASLFLLGIGICLSFSAT
jgi:hypothetical protein